MVKTITCHATDEFIQKVKSHLTDKNCKYSFNKETQLLYYENRLVVPDSLIQELLDYFHTSNLAGHAGMNRMQLWLFSHFYFPNMTKIIHDYVSSCEVCCRANAPNKTLGLLQSPHIPLVR